MRIHRMLWSHVGCAVRTNEHGSVRAAHPTLACDKEMPV